MNASVGGSVFLVGGRHTGPTKQTVDAPLAPNLSGLVEPGASITRTLEVRAHENCGGSVHFTINSVSIDVIGAR